MELNKNKTALVIIDVQDGFNDPMWGKRSNPYLESNVARVLNHWRKQGLASRTSRSRSVFVLSQLC